MVWEDVSGSSGYICYEIKEKIGAGGGGVVYLGRHMRLEKDVVLKADKRKLSAGTESLRREVDMLKNLSHTNVPQVYDFIQEDGMVYTVMDYIEGESFDKLLAEGRQISQADAVKWACQLLDALAYLHSRPPYGILHGDIKPANIMLHPDGDICLIDYNIALALGVLRMHGYVPVRKRDPGSVHATLEHRDLLQTHQKLPEAADRVPQHEL